jgi:hypothetical protein
VARETPKIKAYELNALKNEVDVLDLLPPSLAVLERMVKLIAEGFCIVVSASYRTSGSVTYLDFKKGSPANIMSVELEENGRYHCIHQFCADRYDRLETLPSTVAWHYLIGRAYPGVGGHNLLKS